MQLFEDNFELNGADLLQSLDYITTLGFDYEDFEKNLPALALMQFVARNGCYSNDYLIKARMKQAISLANIGYLQEAIASYQTVIDKKDLVNAGERTSIFIESSKGIYSTKYEALYHNGLTPYDEPNKKTLTDLLATELDKTQFTNYNFAYIKFCRVSILFRAYENEAVSGQNPNEKQDERYRLFKKLEDELKDSLKILSRLEEIAVKKHEIEILQAKMDTGNKENPEILEKRIKEVTRAKDEEGIDIQVSGEKEYVDVRNDILTLMVHCRMLLMKILQAQGMYTDAYNVLNTGITNIRKYCLGLTKIESGNEIKPDVTMIPEGIVAGIGAEMVKGGKKQPPKEEKKKTEAKKKPGKDEPPKEEEQAKSEEERKIEEQKAEEMNKTAEFRGHINPYLWFKMRVELLNILYLQGKYEDCDILIKNIIEDCDKLKDIYFKRLSQQIQCYILVRKGKYEDAEKLSVEILSNAKKANQSDIKLAQFIGNLAEMQYKFKKEPKQIIELLKEARIIFWQLLKNYGLELEPVDINKGNYKAGVFIDQNGHLKDDKYFEGDITKELSSGPQELKFDYTKDLSHSLKYPDKEKNSSYILPNIYLQYLEQLIKIDIRYASAVILEGNYETALRVLSDCLTLAKRTYNVSPSLVFTVHLLSAISNREIFKSKLWSFANIYIAKGKTIKKYEEFMNLVPYGGNLPLGKELFKLPTFSHKLATEYWKFIINAYNDIKSAVKLICEESVLLYDFEENLNATKTFQEYSDICRLLYEYCPRKVYFYADYEKFLKEEFKKKDFKLSDPDLLKKVQEKLQNDETEYQKLRNNYACECVVALMESVKCEKIRKTIMDGYPELSQTTLIDSSRAPKDIICEIFESDYHYKKLYKELPSIEIKPKTALATADLLAYFISLSNELKFFSFGKENQARRLSKLHRYLKSNLSTYASQCCITFNEFDPSQATKIQRITGLTWSWTTNGYGKRIIGNYALGQIEEKSGDIYLGIVNVDTVEIGKLYQDTNNLLKSFKESSTKSEEVFNRDKELMRPKYIEIIKRIGYLFAPNTIIDSVKDFVKIIPEFNEENLKEIIKFLGIYGGDIDHKELCNLIRLFHETRFKLK